jgi:RNA polymerase sigma factor for flagellar operon FliA
MNHPLVADNISLVESLARRMEKRLPKCVDVSDLTHEGIFGLMDAARSFDPARGVLFSTFARRRINGAMLDHLRNIDWTPRLARTLRKKLSGARERLRGSLGRDPTDTEMAAELRMSPKQYKKARAELSEVCIISLNRKAFENDRGNPVSDAELLICQRSEQPESRSHRLSMIDRVCEGMNRAEKLAFRLYWFEQMTMKETGRAIGLSESRVSQMMSNLIPRVRSRFTESEFREVLGLGVAA